MRLLDVLYVLLVDWQAQAVAVERLDHALDAISFPMGQGPAAQAAQDRLLDRFGVEG